MIVDILALVAGLVALVLAADHFVLGASRIASIVRLPPVVIGAVVIGFGTSLPEMVVSIIAANGGDLALGTGNIVGSNVANLGLVLGVAAWTTSLAISPTTLRREIPLSIGATLLMALLYVDGAVARWEGAILLVALVAAISFLVRSGLVDDLGDDDAEQSAVSREVLRTAGGLVGTVIGAQLVVWGATGVATAWGLTGGFIGFSLVAFGTSLPELVTTFACARRGETGLIIGNLFGSNLFNALAVGGGIGLVGAGSIDDDVLTTWGIALMVTVALMAVALSWRGRFVGRSDGVVLIALYLVSMTVLGVGSRGTDESESGRGNTDQHHIEENR